MEATLYISPYRTSRFEPLRKDDDPRSTLPNEEVKLELKPLPSNLRYVFLDSNSKFSFIVNSSFPSNNVNTLCDMLLCHKNVIGYSINDLKGIGPNV